MMSFTICTNGRTGKEKRYSIMLLSIHGGYVVEDDIPTKSAALKRRTVCRRAWRAADPQEVFAVQRGILKIIVRQIDELTHG